MTAKIRANLISKHELKSETHILAYSHKQITIHTIIKGHKHANIYTFMYKHTRTHTSNLHSHMLRFLLIIRLCKPTSSHVNTLLHTYVCTQKHACQLIYTHSQFHTFTYCFTCTHTYYKSLSIYNQYCN